MNIAISFPNTYPLDSAIERLNNRGQEKPLSQLSFWGSREKSRENRTRKKTRAGGGPLAHAVSRDSKRRVCSQATAGTIC